MSAQANWSANDNFVQTGEGQFIAQVTKAASNDASAREVCKPVAIAASAELEKNIEESQHNGDWISKNCSSLEYFWQSTTYAMIWPWFSGHAFMRQLSI